MFLFGGNRTGQSRNAEGIPKRTGSGGGCFAASASYPPSPQILQSKQKRGGSVSTRGYYIMSIIDHLGTITRQVEDRCAQGLTDLNILLENHIRDVLNVLYGYNLVNLNHDSPNAPGLDLGDPDAKGGVAYQVTSRADSRKVNDTLSAITDEQLERYSTIRIFVIGSRQKKYTIDTGLAARCRFSQDDIIDVNGLIADIVNADITTIKQLQRLLADENEEVKLGPSDGAETQRTVRRNVQFKESSAIARPSRLVQWAFKDATMKVSGVRGALLFLEMFMISLGFLALIVGTGIFQLYTTMSGLEAIARGSPTTGSHLAAIVALASMFVFLALTMATFKSGLWRLMNAEAATISPASTMWVKLGSRMAILKIERTGVSNKSLSLVELEGCCGVCARPLELTTGYRGVRSPVIAECVQYPSRHRFRVDPSTLIGEQILSS